MHSKPSSFLEIAIEALNDLAFSKPTIDASLIVSAEVVDSKLAEQMAFSGRWNTAYGMSCDPAGFLAEHPQIEWVNPLLKSRPSQPWTVFQADLEY